MGAACATLMVQGEPSSGKCHSPQPSAGLERRLPGGPTAGDAVGHREQDVPAKGAGVYPRKTEALKEWSKYECQSYVSDWFCGSRLGRPSVDQ